MSEHALLSPSKADRWIYCPGSIVASAGVEDTGSVYAEEGTLAHTVAAARMTNGPCPAMADDESCEYVSVYTRAVGNAAEGKILLVEQRLDIEKWTSEKGGKGTSDAVIIDLAARNIEVWDLKFGQGYVVDAQDNPQLMLYALGALDLVECVYGEMETIKLVICQPRRDHISEHTITRAELLAFGAKARQQGELALALCDPEKQELTGMNPLEHLHPSEKACLWCPIKATCPALMELIKNQVFDEFEVLDDHMMNVKLKVPGSELHTPSAEVLELVGQWLAATKEYIDERLKAGTSIPGWKLVRGKKGNRKWRDETKVEDLLKRLRFKKAQTHEESLIPLTKIEKIVPRDKWPLFEALIVQADGQPIAVPSSDGRPEYSTATAEDFQSTEDNYDAFT